MIVVDASVILELLLHTRDADAITERLLDPRETLHAPELLDVEVAQVLRRYVHRRELTPDRGLASLDLLGAMPIARYSHRPLLRRIWALRPNLTAYDAAYVALAEGLRATLLTRDAAIARTRGIAARVEIV